MLNWIVTLPMHTFDEKRNRPPQEEEDGVGDD